MDELIRNKTIIVTIVDAVTTGGWMRAGDVTLKHGDDYQGCANVKSAALMAQTGDVIIIYV